MVDATQIIFAVGFLIVLVYLISRILLKPLKLVFKLIVNSVFGLMLLWGFNFIGAMFHILIPINVPTVLIAGFLGLPGLILLIILQFIL